MRVGTDAVYAAFTLASDAAAHNIDLVVHVTCIALFCIAIVGAGLSSNTKEADVANVLGGSVSVISLAYVFHCYFVRGWRRHPNRLLIYRSMSDLVSALAVIGFAVAEGVDTGWGARGSSCSVLAVVFNPGVLLFSFFASEAWGLVLIHDVVRMIRNPMRAPSSATWRDYHAVVWGASLLYTLLALGPGPWEERKWFEPRGDLAVHREIARNCSASCDNHIHLERLPALTRLPTVNTLPVECWRRYRYEDIPGGTFIAFWWILAFNLLSVVFLVYIARQMAASSHNALRARQAAISRCFSSILVNLSYWAVLYTLCVLSVLPVDPEACSWQHHDCYDERADPTPVSLLSLFQLMLGAQGFTSMLLWMRLNRVGLHARRGGGADLTKEDEGAPEENTVLRREILAHISAGVRRTAAVDDATLAALPPGAPLRFELDAHRHSPPPVLVSRTTTMVNTVASALSSFAATFATALSAPPVPFDALAPASFRRIREATALSEAAFAGLQIEDRAGGLQGGASGAFVFSSVDGAVVVKTLDAAEAELLCELAPAFAAHFDAHPTSLINRFLGCFRMKLYSQTIHFVVVSSVFAAATRAEVAAPAALLRRLDATAGAAGAAAEKLEAALRRLTGRTRGAERRKSTTLLLHYRSERRADGAVIFAAEGGPARLELLEAVEVLDDGGDRRGDNSGGATEGVRLLHKLRPAALYDLKGSSIDRYVKPKRKNAGKTLKDDNLRSHGLQPHGERLPLRTADGRAAALLAQLAADSAFLREVGVMDYSLLLAVFPGGLGDGAAASPAYVGGAGGGAEGERAMLVGVIDVLQRWTWGKAAERCAKATFQCKDRWRISAVPPGRYQERFMEFMFEIFGTPPPPEAGGGSVGVELLRRAGSFLKPEALV